MNYKDYSEIQRLLGVIEGAAFGTSEPIQGLLIGTVSDIDEILKRNTGDNND